jgi:Zn-finger nucleic acid-binding protein
MPPRRPKPTAASRARAARISAALEGILDDLPAPDAEPSRNPTSPYRPLPAGAKSNQRREGLDCPGCQSPMEVEVQRGVEIHRCIGCAGLWLDPGELESMVDEPRHVQPDVARLREGMKEVEVPRGPVRYRKCPRCTQVMSRRNFGSHSGVIVDECRTHGLYLDPGEFEAIETFIKLGGLSLERKREVYEAKRAAQRANLEAAHAKAAASIPRAHGHHHHGSWSSILSWFFS